MIAVIWSFICADFLGYVEQQTTQQCRKKRKDKYACGAMDGE